MARTVFHIGYMKTATTLLQGEVFPRLEQASVHSYASRFPHRAYALRDTRDQSDLAELANDMRSWIVASPDDLTLFSWEGLVGDYLGDYRDAGMMLDLMRRVAPDAHVVLVIRRQAELANSLYKQALHRGHWPRFEQFVNYRDGRLGPFRPDGPANMSIASLDFDAAVGRYEQAFGPDRVHVLAYEWLRTEPDRFWAGLSGALGRPVARPSATVTRNVGYNSTTARMARRLNRLFRTPQNPGGLLPYRPFDRRLQRGSASGAWRKLLTALNAPFDPRWLLQGRLGQRMEGSSDLVPPPVRVAIDAACADSNRTLDRRRDLGLEALGYY